MTEERKTDSLYKSNRLQWAGILFLFVFAILARTRLDNVSTDMVKWLIPWYDYIQKNGILVALGDNFSNYTPPYTYLLALTTLLPVSKVVAIKLIPVTMDFMNAFMIYKIIRYKYPLGLAPFYAAAVFLCLPTVILNSAFWGQADSLYTGLLLATIYFFLKERPFWAMVAFSASFTFKAQAVFMAPLLAILLLRSFRIPKELFPQKKIRFWHFFLIPIVYIFLSLPVVLLGRSLRNVLAIYLHQSTQYHSLSANAANLYIFISNDFYQPGVWVGLVLAALCLGLWVVFTAKSVQPVHGKRLLLVALTSVTLVPFLLPQMHDRYFYPADVLSLVVAFFLPELWFLPLAYQLISGLSYIPFLWSVESTPVFIAALINTIVVLFLLVKQFRN